MGLPSEIRRTFLYSHFFISICAAGMWLHTLAVAGLPLTITPAFLVLPAATLVYYNFHKFSYRLDSLRPGSIWKTVMDPSVRAADRASFFFGGVAVLVGLIWSSPALIAAWTAAACFALMYSFPVIRRLREIPLLKMVAVSTVWALTTVVFPLLEAGTATDMATAFFFKFALVFALCVPFEIRDQQRESERGIPSVMRYGRMPVVLVALFMLAVAVALQFFQMSTGRSTTVIFFSHLSSALPAALWLFITRPDWPGWYFKGVVDGTMLLPFLVLILL